MIPLFHLSLYLFFTIYSKGFYERGGGYWCQSAHEQPDPEPTHRDIGNIGDTSAHGHLRPQRLLRGGTGACSLCEKAGEETLFNTCYSGKVMILEVTILYVEKNESYIEAYIVHLICGCYVYVENFASS